MENHKFLNNMRVVLVTAKLPTKESGSTVRNYYILRFLQKHYTHVSLLSLLDPAETMTLSHYQQTFFAHTSFISPPAFSLKKRIQSLLFGNIPYVKRLEDTKLTTSQLKQLEQADIIQIEELDAFFVLQKYLPKLSAKIILDAHNIDTIRFQGELAKKDILQRLLGKLLIKKLHTKEITAIQKIDHLFVCSEHDRQYFAKYISPDKIEVVANGVDTAYIKKTPLVKKHTILFVGLLSYLPNSNAVAFFLKNIYPSILRKLPDAELTIVGKHPPQWLEAYANSTPSVTVTGFVPEVIPYIANARVCICPVQEGSGTRLKILEYMAMGKAVVSTAIGAEGIEYTKDADIVIADDPSMFANAVIKLLTNDTQTMALGLHAQKLISNTYTWNSTLRRIQDIYNNL